MHKIAVDLMGGDHAPESVLDGVKLALAEFDDIEITLVGDETKVPNDIKEHERINIVNTDVVLDMGVEDPIKEVRKNPKASLFLAMREVKDERADVVISAGPTQAVVAGGHLILRRIPGIKRVGIAPFIPDFNGGVRILIDAGANLELRPEHLVDYALISTVIAENLLHIENPKVGLLNIGTEPGKGREVEREAHELLSNTKTINFGGNVEPKELLNSNFDIIVTDGFTGNILLKSYEGAAISFGKAIKEEIMGSFKGKLGGLFLKGNLKSLKEKMDSSHVGGALVLGVNGLLIKAHGSSNGLAIYNAIRQAREMASNEVYDLIKKAVERKN